MLIECIVRQGLDGSWQSVPGTGETVGDDLLAFYCQGNERLKLSRVARSDDTTVEIVRSYRLSDVEAERTICICDSVEEADRLVSSLNDLVEG